MTPKQHMRSLLQRIATGPELSKDVTVEEARSGMRSILEGLVDPVQAGLFLIALRMKRETDDELIGVQHALLEKTNQLAVEADILVEISDPFNGYNRGLPMSPFLPAVLAACGVPAIGHGVTSVGPKHGITHKKVLTAAGLNTDMELPQVHARLQDPKIGWAYVDQKVSCPALHDLLELRELMVKRTCLTTIEVAIKPVRARKRTHLVTGFVHKPYPPIYAMLAKNAGYESSAIVRGVEGGVIPSLQQPSRVFSFFDDEPAVERRVDPGTVGIASADNRAVPIPREMTVGEDEELDVGRAASVAADLGIAALKGERGLAYDSLVYGGAIVLHSLGMGTMEEAADAVRNVLENGDAASRIN